jgi:hypothetical protein
LSETRHRQAQTNGRCENISASLNRSKQGLALRVQNDHQHPMISPVTGEVLFSDGVRFSPHDPLSRRHLHHARAHVSLPIPGWTQHFLGIHPSDRGSFEIEAVSGPESRIQAVLLAHSHSFYQPDTPNDSERRAFHQGVIAADLCGQREFSWGQAFCRLEPTPNKDWLVVVYSIGPPVPLYHAALLRHLREHEPVPDRPPL